MMMMMIIIIIVQSEQEGTAFSWGVDMYSFAIIHKNNE